MKISVTAHIENAGKNLCNKCEYIILQVLLKIFFLNFLGIPWYWTRSDIHGIFWNLCIMHG